MGIELLLPSQKTLDGYRIFKPSNKDPFDNALIVSAINEGCFLLTSDPKILETRSKGLKLLDATT